MLSEIPFFGTAKNSISLNRLKPIIKSGASDADLAAALFNMIYENVGVMASLALSQDTTRNVVLTGSLASLAPAAKTFDIFNQMHDVFGIDYIIPPHPSFATAVGALLCDPLPEN